MKPYEEYYLRAVDEHTSEPNNVMVQLKALLTIGGAKALNEVKANQAK